MSLETKCNRSACQNALNPRNRWWNATMFAWYCQPCAFKLNEASPGLCVPEVEMLRTRLRAAEERAERAEARAGKARERIAELRTNADAIEAKIPPHEVAAVAEAEQDLAKIRGRIAELEAALRHEREHERAQEQHVAKVREVIRQATADRERADRLRVEATQLEAVLAEAAPTPVSDDELAAAARAEAEATEALVVAREADAAGTAAIEAMARANAAGGLEEHAERLDEIVRRLSKDAPAALLATVTGIDGLAIEGDTVRLDGVALDALCGQEQMTLALRIAKRLSKAKVLLVDGLEALDPEQRERFVAEATANGWQLLATLVDRGDVAPRGDRADGGGRGRMTTDKALHVFRDETEFVVAHDAEDARAVLRETRMSEDAISPAEEWRQLPDDDFVKWNYEDTGKPQRVPVRMLINSGRGYLGSTER